MFMLFPNLRVLVDRPRPAVRYIRPVSASTVGCLAGPDVGQSVGCTC